MKKNIISIAGTLGSGKSSTADLIAKELGYKRFSSGDFMRKIALKKGVTLNELSILAETNPSIDIAIDDEVRKIGELENIVIDSRLAFHFIPESFKVYLDLPPEIAKNRILNNLKENALRKQSENATTGEEIYKKIIDRLESEKKRYKELYNIVHTDKNNYDLVIDTEKNNLQEVVQIVLDAYRKWQQK
ncbi:MAG: AAA family ATPase [Candidatus Pacebacteria bacterium]|nr:AAA family ATPase [Candidatus Paceibacterota bacterium]MCF7862510.1 AAA family ATPase [Candidatus Paceibacterota bacterium]